MPPSSILQIPELDSTLCWRGGGEASYIAVGMQKWGRFILWLSNPISVISSPKDTCIFMKWLVYKVFISAMFMIAKVGNNSSVHHLGIG